MLLLWATVSLAPLSFVGAGCNYSDVGFFECVEEKYIYLNEEIGEATSNLNEMKLDVGKIDMPPPVECVKDYCYEETNVIVVIKKTRKPLLAVVNSDTLPSREFAEKFDDIQEETKITNKSPIFDRVTLQKVLHDRGLLGVEPTGKIWYLTELAVMKLQCLKGYSEYNPSKDIFEIGPRTIQEVNALKERMKDENYLKDSRLPEVNLAECGDEFTRRQAKIGGLLKTPPTRANNHYGNYLRSGSSLQWDGEVVLKKVD